MISIRSIDFQKGKMSIKWAKSANVPEDDCLLLVSHEPPLPAFIEALESLRGCLVKELDLPDSWELQLSVSGVLLKKKDNYRLIQINASRDVERTGQVMPVKMPEKPEPSSPIGQADPNRALSADTVEAVRNLEAEAAAFIAGQRMQGDLFEEGGEQ